MKRPPNIVLLQGEDLGRHLGCYGDAAAHTPHLDALARQGLRYTNAFTHAPVCAPSRGGMVTGRYPYSLGNHHMRSTLCTPPRPFVRELREAGYFVNWPTKLDFNFDPEEGWRDAATPWHEEAAPREPFSSMKTSGSPTKALCFQNFPTGTLLLRRRRTRTGTGSKTWSARPG